jgi:hypothetical protein
MGEPFNHQQFVENLNSKFRLTLEDGEVFELKLTEVSDIHGLPSQETYSISFVCPADQILPQRVYRLEHDAMGALDLFIVPVSKDDQGVLYEAVFNRVLENAKSSGSMS